MLQLNIESSVCRFLREHHTGRANAASNKTLEAAFNIKGSEVRKIVNSLRCAGYPVCSDTADYYYAATHEEVNATIAQLNGRITKISNARNELLMCTKLNRVPPIHIDINIKLSLEGVS